MSNEYQNPGPSRDEIDATPGCLVLEFGTSWCGHCQGAAPLVAKALEKHSDVMHIKVEDGPGRRLGRSFGVKLWPTLIFLRGGEEVARVVRPETAGDVEQALGAIA